MLLYEGCPLIGTKIQHGILNGVWYDVVQIDETHLYLKDEKDVEMRISFDKAAQVLTLRHAMTVHKSQSRTIEGHIRIHPGKEAGDVSRYWSLNHLLVAASRATELANLSIE